MFGSFAGINCSKATSPGTAALSENGCRRRLLSSSPRFIAGRYGTRCRERRRRGGVIEKRKVLKVLTVGGWRRRRGARGRGARRRRSATAWKICGTTRRLSPYSAPPRSSTPASTASPSRPSPQFLPKVGQLPLFLALCTLSVSPTPFVCLICVVDLVVLKACGRFTLMCRPFS